MTKVLISGGAGFVASHLIEHLLRATDWEIVILDKLAYASNGMSRLRDIKAFDQLKKRVSMYAVDVSYPISVGLEKEIGAVDYIIHMAAESDVNRSITDPRPFIQSNVVGTMEMLQYARKLQLKAYLQFSTDEVFGPCYNGAPAFKEWSRYYPTNPYSSSKAAADMLCLAWANTYGIPLITTHCHDEETKCWTESGFKSYRELKVGEKVWVLKKNKRLALEPIKEIIVNYWDDYLIQFKGVKFNLAVTPDHRMLTRKRREKEYSIKRASTLYDLKQGERHYLPLSGEWIGKESPVIDLSKICKRKNGKEHFNAKKIPSKFDTKELFRFAGWYLSEGCCYKRNGDATGVDIACRNSKNRKAIVSCVRKLGLNPVLEKCGDVNIHSVIFARFARTLGMGYANKRIPRWMLGYAKPYLQCLLDSLLAGDGTIQPSYTRYYTSCFGLAQDVAELAIKLGYSANIKHRYTNWTGEQKKRLSYYVNITYAAGSLESRQISRIPYKGKVWCLKVPSGNFFTYRNGNIVCSGNCMNVFGQRQHPEKFIPMVVRSILRSETIYIHTDPTRTKAGSRAYIHGRNVAAAVQFILENTRTIAGMKLKEKFNIAGEKEVDNLALATMIHGIMENALNHKMDLKIEMVDFHSSRPGHDLRYALDGRKLADLGWSPPKNFEESLQKTIEWSLKPENLHWLMLD